MSMTAAPPRPDRTISVTPAGFIISFPYDGKLVQATRSLPGRRYDSNTRQWRVPKSAGPAVRAFAEKYGFTIHGELAAAIVLPEASGPTGGTISLDADKFVIRLAGKNHPSATQELRLLPGREWHASLGVSLVPVAGNLGQVVAFGRRWGLEIDPRIVAAAEKIEARAAELRALSKAEDGEVSCSTPDGLAFRPYQRGGIVYARRQRRTFIADGMGVGKTAQAIGAVMEEEHHTGRRVPTVCVVPSSVKINWVREWQMWAPTYRVQMIVGNRPGQIGTFFRPDVVVVNYDVLGSYDPDLDQTWGNLTDLVEFLGDDGVLIVDECHYVKTPKARRTQALQCLASNVRSKGMVLMLSGTPLLNRPDELITQLDVLGRLDEFGGPSRFKSRYCLPKKAPREERDARGLELHARLRSSCYLRRLKKDVLKDLPPKIVTQVPVETDPVVMAEYRRAEADVVNFLAERARQLAKDMGLDDEDADELAWEKAMRAQAAEHLVRINALKQLAVKAKLPAALRWIDDFLGSTDDQLVLFANHREIVNTLADRYGGLKIQGGQNLERDRQPAIDDFQAGKGRVISCAIAAGGIGITLTAASDVAFLEQGWNPGTHEQAEDRCHRIGQTDTVNAYYLLAQGTIDEMISDLIEQKRGVIGPIQDGEIADDVESSGSVLGDVLVALAHKGMGRPGTKPEEHLPEWTPDDGGAQ